MRLGRNGGSATRSGWAPFSLKDGDAFAGQEGPVSSPGGEWAVGEKQWTVVNSCLLLEGQILVSL